VIRRLVIRSDALEEIDEAAAWYEQRRRGLSSDFITVVDAAIRTVHRYPFRYPLIFKQARHLVLKGFPYSIIFFVTDDEVVIVSCFHERRAPRDWQDRL
jgi:plasmid stabilization system protein ParE